MSDRPVALLAVLLLYWATAARAEQEPAAELPPEAATSAPTPPPYSLPWQLRPVPAVSVVRSDTSFASWGPSNEALTVASLLLVSYKLTPTFAVLTRVGLVHNSPPGGPGGTAVVNPVIAGTNVWTLIRGLDLNLFVGITLPVGMGGGNNATSQAAAAASAGILARSAMDNAMFAVNDFTIFPGLGLAWIAGGFTAQIEATVLQLIRVRGALATPDRAKTNLTSGVHLGYFVLPWLSLGGEVRMQRWLSTPASVKADPSQRDNFTFAVGPRFHFRSGDIIVRPGISYAQGLDDPMLERNYRIVQLDVPVAF